MYLTKKILNSSNNEEENKNLLFSNSSNRFASTFMMRTVRERNSFPCSVFHKRYILRLEETTILKASIYYPRLHLHLPSDYIVDKHILTDIKKSINIIKKRIIIIHS